MFFLYSLILTIGFIILSPRFLLDAATKGKYAAGFWQRLGYVPKFEAHGRKVVWVHCVSVGEVNAARPLIARIKRDFPNHSIVISTTTRTGQTLARTAFDGMADAVFYFPLDWKSSVRRTLRAIRPSVILLTETEIWPNFIREASKSGARLAIVNGRLSEKSLARYGKARKFIRRVLGYLELALMQDKSDATRMMSLGLRANKVKVTGNLKFDHDLTVAENEVTQQLRQRFAIDAEAPLIIAASTHAPEERLILDAFKELWKSSPGRLPRLLIAPRHPERFAEVAELIKKCGFAWVRRSEGPSARDTSAEVILLDSIGELRAAYPLAAVVFVGGSLLPHGGQSVFEPAAAGKAIVVGPHTANFEAAVTELLECDAIIQLPEVPEAGQSGEILKAFNLLLAHPPKAPIFGANALEMMDANRGAVDHTLEYLAPMLSAPVNR